jgi:transposase
MTHKIHKIPPLRLAAVIREHCEIVLGMTGGKVREAAKILEIGWSTLYRWIAEWKREDEGEGEEQ